MSEATSAGAGAGAAMEYVPQAPSAQGTPQLMQMGSLDAQQHSTYPMQGSSAKSEVPYASGSYAPPMKEGGEQTHNAQVDPNISSRRDASTGYAHVRQDQPAYRLDLLQTDPNLESGAALGGDQDQVSRAFPFLSNSISGQGGDSRAPIFSHNFVNVAQDEQHLNYAKKNENSPGEMNNIGKASRGASYDSLASEKKETPYSRSPSLRVTHKIAERKRRKEMKDLFDELKEFLPIDRGPKTSKGDILSKAVLQLQSLHREREHLLEALEAAHHELNQLRSVAGGEHSAIQPHVYPHATPQYMPRSSDQRLHGVVQTEQHAPLIQRDKAHEPVSVALDSQRSESFLQDLRLDRLRQGDDGVHAQFKPLESTHSVLDASSLGARPFAQEYAPPEQPQTNIPASEHIDNRQGAREPPREPAE
ncbi:hypothetical protein MCUN1_002114 [Malassezia cuniculi]|uniref:BHLH domain-containing protein n=1 Tax=Malassezia cuniculi TaxID=948313 RepID=A0AAF0J6I5_9BASI|nr:hypothetical protein MCUN1_002114 [Malassezia cuniculi]